MAKGIMKIKDGVYRGRFSINGKRYSMYGKTIKEVAKQMNDKRYEIEHGMVDTVKSISVDNWFKLWIDEYKRPVLNCRTLEIYLSCYRLYIKSYLGHMKLEEVKGMHIQKLFNALASEKQLSKGTLINVRKAVNGMFEQAVRNDILYKNPVKALVIPKTQEKQRKKVLTVKEQDQLISAAKDNYYYNLLVFALHTGLRIGEITGLTWSDIDYHENIIKVRRNLNYYSSTGFYVGEPKTKSSVRDVPMTQAVVKLLKEQKKKQLEEKLLLGSSYNEHETIKNTIFTSETGSLIHEQMFNRTLKKICKKSSIEPITPHGLRHTFATRCIEKGMQPQTLKSILGHSSLSMTMDLYAHVLNDTKQLEIKVLEKV